MSGRGPGWRVIASTVLLAALVVLAPRLALAHGKLKRSAPGAGAHLGEVPREIRLDFNEAPELINRLRRGADIAGGEQRLAPIERQVGARWVVHVEPVDGAAEQVRGDRQIVARQRPPSGSGEMPRRSLT